MRELPDTTGYDGYGETSGEAGDSSTDSSRKAFYQDIIRKANTIPLIRILKYYGVKVNSTKSTIICPFKHHKGGHENTASFTFYPDTNSFHCHGCRTGGPWAHACEFSAFFEGISKAKAGYKIIKLFENDIVHDGEIIEVENSSERLEIMMDFSNAVREFRQNHPDDEANIFVEKICMVYDDVHLNHSTLDITALRSAVEKLKEKIISYKLCPKQ